MLFPFSLLGVCGCGQLLILMTRTRYDHQHQISLRLDNCFRGGAGRGRARMAAAEKCCPGDLATSETKTDGWHPADWTLE